jgi:histidine kinase
MFKSLMLVKKFKTVHEDERNNIIDIINKNLKKLKVWADNSPANFAHKYYIVSAEFAKIKNEPIETIRTLYKKSLNSIQTGDFINMKAIINELIGTFWIENKEEIIGKSYIKEAYYFYMQWGAFAKANILQNKYAHIISNQQVISVHPHNSNETTRKSTVMSDISLDFLSVLKSTQAISSEIKIDKLLKVLMNTIIENAAAQNGCLILRNTTNDDLYIQAIKYSNSNNAKVMCSTPINESDDFCREIVQYVSRTMESIVVSNAYKNHEYKNNPYIQNRKIKSIICIPIIYQNKLKGIIYLENNLTSNAFNVDKLEVLKILSSQIAISIENAELYEKLEDKVIERTKQLELANIELKELSLHDYLTKLYNRRYVYEYISTMTESFVKAKKAQFYNNQKRDVSIGNNVLGIFMIDIDHFKNVNDTYGHACGDELLIEITKILKSLIREDDFIIRWGGEEFLIILNKTKIEYLETLSEKILTKVENTPMALSNGIIINKTCSIGCTHMPFDTNLSDFLTLEQSINLSDYALYKAKENGRNCAAHLGLNPNDSINTDDIRNYLVNLNKNAPYNENIIKINYVQTKLFSGNPK